MADEVRLIDAELLTINIAQIANACAKSDKQKALIGRILFMIENMPTIEAETVKHGWWMDNPTQSQLYSYICSNCRTSCDWTYRYCPNCGSKNRMDGDSE